VRPPLELLLPEAPLDPLLPLPLLLPEAPLLVPLLLLPPLLLDVSLPLDPFDPLLLETSPLLEAPPLLPPLPPWLNPVPPVDGVELQANTERASEPIPINRIVFMGASPSWQGWQRAFETPERLAASGNSCPHARHVWCTRRAPVRRAHGRQAAPRYC
jgi:hypothetical protein